jgi:flagellar hook-basal body complex protein FliE
MRLDALASAGASARTPMVGEAAAGRRPSPGSAVPSRETDFAEALRRGMSGLADIQAAADQAAQSIAVGDLAQLHNAIITMQKASLALEFVIAVRNHVVDGIQELLRTQV